MLDINLIRENTDRVKAGVARPLDLAQTEAEAAGARTALIDARSKVVTARSGLALVIGVPSVRNKLVDEFEVPTMPPLEELQVVASAHRPDLLAADALVRVAHNALKAAYAEYLPSVTLDFDYFLHKTSFPPDSLWAFGVGVNIPLFHGGKIYAGVRRAASLVRQAQLFDSLTHRQVAEQVEVAYEDLRASAERLDQRRAQVRAAAEAFGLANQSYDVGLATNLEQLIAQDRMLQADLQLAAETLNHKILYLNLVQAVGELVEEVAKLPGASVAPEAVAAK
jgi:outer membrane protein TolC